MKVVHTNVQQVTANIIWNIFTDLKPDKVKHIACGRSHTIVSTGEYI